MSAVKQYQCKKCMLKTVGGLVEHSDEIEISAEVINAEEIRHPVNEDYVYCPGAMMSSRSRVSLYPLDG